MKCDECKWEKELKEIPSNALLLCYDCIKKLKKEKKKMNKYLFRKLANEVNRKKRYKSFIEKQLSKRK